MLAAVLAAIAIGAFGLAAFLSRGKSFGIWLRPYVAYCFRARPEPDGPIHVMFCFVDHFEPQWQRPAYAQECARVARWRRDYPTLCKAHRDSDGRAPTHTFFYPAEEYRPEHLEPLVELCRQGLGEIDVHLHHADDTAEGLRASLREFVATLTSVHDCLPVDTGTGTVRWGFIHGSWALNNARPDGKWCGVDDELTILREEGCYADFTLPCAPDVSQTRTINSIYYATASPGRPKAHDGGERVRVGGRPTGDLMIIQGPLGFMWHNRKYGFMPKIENGDVRRSMPPTARRVDDWVRTGIHVAGRPEWVFVKVHTHGTQERDMDTLLGEEMSDMFSYLESAYNDGKRYVLHYVSAREMYNIVKAAEAGMTGNPGQYRDFCLTRPAYRRPGSIPA